MKRIVLLILCFMLASSTAVAEQSNLATLWGIEWGEPIAVSLEKLENVTGLKTLEWTGKGTASFFQYSNGSISLLNVPVEAIFIWGSESIIRLDVRFVMREDPAADFQTIYQAMTVMNEKPVYANLIVPQITLAGREEKMYQLPFSTGGGLESARQVVAENSEYSFNAAWQNAILQLQKTNELNGMCLGFVSQPFEGEFREAPSETY